ncbi:hypothetical protein [Jiulongibacter sediminis]|uniref:hypothetical protein n=1 Tax=Jiulongibacter sediminis TaxID=1605367 RepID=UPI0026EF4539|nr:hypothetical protein [Jiulongibacter sediminis]
MKTHLKKYLLCAVLLAMAQSSFSQIEYRTRYQSAIIAEGFGISPVMSINYENAIVRRQKHFYTTRIGVGFLPAKRSSPKGISIPVQASYVFMLPKLLKDFLRPLNTFPPRFKFETFIETGPGYSHIFYKNDNRGYINAFLGIRQQLLIDIPPKPTVIFARISVNPRVNRKGLVFYERTDGGGQNFFGGFALGVSI